MIIECPSCTSRYRISDDKLPETGGNIKCPNCAHVFFVMREGLATAAAAGPRIADSLANPAIEEAAAEAVAAVAAVAESRATRWKLKNAVGLVYDFPSTEQLRTWLGTRESHDGFQVSNDGGAKYRPLSEAPEFEGVKPAGRTSGPAAGNSSGGASRTAPNRTPANDDPVAKMREEARARLDAKRNRNRDEEEDEEEEVFDFHAPKPPSRQQQQTTKILIGMAALILPLVAAVILHVNGVIDLGNLSFFGSNSNVPQYVPPPRSANTEDSERHELTPEQAVNRLMTLAAAAQSRNEPDVAIEHLQQAIEVTPEDATLHCLLVPLYTEAGRADEAQAAERLCNPPAEGSGENAGDGSGDGSGASDDGSGQDAPADPNEEDPTP